MTVLNAGNPVATKGFAKCQAGNRKAFLRTHGYFSGKESVVGEKESQLCVSGNWRDGRRRTGKLNDIESQ